MGDRRKPVLYFIVLILCSAFVLASYTVTLNTPADSDTVTGVSYSVNVTSDVYANITNVTIWVNGSIVCANDSVNETEYICAWDTTATADGNYKVTANATNSSGSLLNDSSEPVYVDNTPPSVILVYPDNFTNYTISNINFSWIANDSVDYNISCNLSIDEKLNTSNIGVDNNTLYNISLFIGDGNHNWSVSCWDNASLTNTSPLYTFNIDN